MRPAIEKTPKIKLTLSTGVKLNCLISLYFVNSIGQIVGNISTVEFVSSDTEQEITIPIMTPNIDATYAVYIDVYVEGELFKQYFGSQTIQISSSPTVPNALDAVAYFDDVASATYSFMQGTKHKLTVEFKNPYSIQLDFYVAGILQNQLGIGSLNPFNAWGFIRVAAGATVKKELNFYASETIGTTGAYNLEVTPVGGSGITTEKASIQTGSVSIVNNPTPVSGTMELVPSKTSIKQGEVFGIDIKITNTSNRIGAFPVYVILYDKNNAFITGIAASAMSVGPGETSTVYTYNPCVLYGESGANPFGYPPTGNMYIKGKFGSRDTTWRSEKTVTIVTGTVPTATGTFGSAAWQLVDYWWHFKGSMSSSFVGTLPNGEKPSYAVYVLCYNDSGRTDLSGLIYVWGDQLNKADGSVAVDADLGNSTPEGRYTKIVVVEYHDGWTVYGVKSATGPTRSS